MKKCSLRYITLVRDLHAMKLSKFSSAVAAFQKHNTFSNENLMMTNLRKIACAKWINVLPIFHKYQLKGSSHSRTSANSSTSIMPRHSLCTRSLAGFYGTNMPMTIRSLSTGSASPEIAKYSSTIFSLSSGHGKCGVSVIRVSGPDAATACKLLTKSKKLPKPRRAALYTLYHPKSDLALDKALVLWFAGPQSFTGEDSCEFHTHGGPAVVAAVLEALAGVPGLRHAEPGEYTKRAFQNGKMDLVEVEGLADLIHAETEFQRQQALRQMDGHLSHVYSRWRKQLIKCVANVEAFIDFSEEDNIEDGVMSEVSEATEKLCEDISAHLRDNRRGERLRNGVQVAIVGQPNVGKSSLLNYLCRRPAAIVSSVAGTTRDVIETAINIGGYPVVLSDTAGLRNTSDVVEVEGVARAKKRAGEADLIVLVIDLSESERSIDSVESVAASIVSHIRNIGLNQEQPHSDYHTEDQIENGGDFLPKEVIVLFNKVDLLQKMPDVPQSVQLSQKSTDTSGISFEEVPICFVSCTSEEGMTQFLELLKEKVKNLCGNPNVGNPSLTQARHRAHLEKCVSALHNYEDIVEMDLVLAAQELRKALYQLGKVTGQVTSEEILDVIFRDFCIGK